MTLLMGPTVLEQIGKGGELAWKIYMTLHLLVWTAAHHLAISATFSFVA